jgi:hypothetical protein
MKPKKLEKKLVVKQVTIVTLTDEKLIKIHGKGTVWTRLCDDQCDVSYKAGGC